MEGGDRERDWSPVPEVERSGDRRGEGDADAQAASQAAAIARMKQLQAAVPALSRVRVKIRNYTAIFIVPGGRRRLWNLRTGAWNGQPRVNRNRKGSLTDAERALTDEARVDLGRRLEVR